jgi:hypothetical protein
LRRNYSQAHLPQTVRQAQTILDGADGVMLGAGLVFRAVTAMKG